MNSDDQHRQVWPGVPGQTWRLGAPAGRAGTTCPKPVPRTLRPPAPQDDGTAVPRP
ncbi:hypothetical protein ACIOJE_40685 [Kitasatospora sp. NPDC087861]|uniref:hypothetical protein n=1 Tax=Kitasatospora sp. NPDC087861 TaxID=3364070 RepID=UPI0037FCF69C